MVQRRAGRGLDPAGRDSDPAGRCSEPAGRISEPTGRAPEPARGPWRLENALKSAERVSEPLGGP